MHVHRLHAGDGVAYHVDETCLRNDSCHPLGDAAVHVGHRVARRALSDCSGPVAAIEERLVPATAAAPVVLFYEEVRLAEPPAAPEEDVGMLIEVVTKTHGPRLHRADHHKRRHGHRVVTAIDVLPSPPRSAPGTHSPPRRPRTRAPGIRSASRRLAIGFGDGCSSCPVGHVARGRGGQSRATPTCIDIWPWPTAGSAAGGLPTVLAAVDSQP